MGIPYIDSRAYVCTIIVLGLFEVTGEGLTFGHEGYGNLTLTAGVLFTVIQPYALERVLPCRLTINCSVVTLAVP